MSAGHQVTFHHLPTELRLQIWSFLSCPRTVVIRRKLVEKTIYLVSLGPIPMVLHVCRESRHYALSKGGYVAAFSMDYVASPAEKEFDANLVARGLRIPDHIERPLPITHYFPVAPYFWVNFDLDTIQIKASALRWVRAQDRGQIRKAIVEVTDTFSFLNYNMHNMSDMKNLQQLDVLSFVDLHSWGRNFGRITSEFEDWFGSQDGWVRPKVRIIEAATGEEMNSVNHTQKETALRARGGGGRYGRALGRGRGEAGRE